MRKFLATGIAALMAAGTLISPASAQFAGSAPAAVTAAEKMSNLTEVRSRYDGRRWHGHRGDRRYYGYRHRHYGHRYYGRRDYYGPAVAAGIIGLTAGAIAAGAANANAYDRDDEYCASRFRSYDPRSGTYLGYDGLRHACP